MFSSWQLLWRKIFAVPVARRRPFRKPTARWVLEVLEDRDVPSTFMVTNTNDSGAHSLRQAILDSNSQPGVNGPNLINFNLGSHSNDEILLNTALPSITNPVVIDGTTNPNPMVDLVAKHNLPNQNGLTIDASGCTIRGLGIGGWSGEGIFIDSSDNVVQGNVIGMLGAADPNGNGIFIDGGNNNTIGGATAANANVVSENLACGIVVDNGQENQIEGNFIGCNSKSQARGNSLNGVEIEGAAAQNNTIGGTAAAAANVISGNGGNGVALITDATFNTVESNFIGTNLGGAVVGLDMGNGGDGVYVGSGANKNFIGNVGSTIENKATAVGNVISGNAQYGVAIAGTGTELNFVESNQIGTNKAGGDALGNRLGGVLIHAGATYNVVGSSAALVGLNLISGNRGDGVILSGMGTTGNLVVNNIINTNLNGTAALSNQGYGVFIEAGASLNTVGTPGAGNVISGDTNFAGVYIVDAGTKGNMVEANLIGVNAADTAKMSDYIGVAIARSATDNTVGGTTTGAGNVISGNLQQGVLITDPGTTGNMIEGNQIGTNQAGTMILANTFSGVVIDNGATGNSVGGPETEAANILSGNGADGVDITGAGTDNNTVEENLIGTNALGTGALGNRYYGVHISGGASDNTVGDGNVISGNTVDGVRISSAGTTGNEVQNNSIGLNAAGNGALANGENGVSIYQGASENGVYNNFISGNADDGIRISGPTTEDNGIQGNFIGTEEDKATPLGNSYGIFIDSGSKYNVIGGVGDGNTIADSTHAGIAVTGNTGVGNTITQNSIFANGGLGIDLGNTGVPLPNKPGTHVGPNDLLNFPVLTGVTSSGNMDVVSGTYNGTPLSFFTIEIFSSPSGDQGKNYLGNVTVSTDQLGNGQFSFTFTPSAANPVLTATATDSQVNTSEFSAPLLIYGLTGTAKSLPYSADVANDNVVVASFSDTNPSAAPGLYTVTINWGDAAPNAPADTSVGTVVADGGGFDVLGTHTYFTVDMHSIIVKIQESNGESVTVNSAAVFELDGN